MARYDFGLTWEEFADLTPKMFQALCKRRNISIKYDRYANAITASAVYNTSRAKAEDPVIHPFDFVMDEEQAEQKERNRQYRQYINKTIGAAVKAGASREKLIEIRAKAIKDLEKAGRMNAEELFDTLWPSLKE